MLRTKVMNIRFFDHEYFWVSDAAKAAQMSIAEYVRISVLNTTNCPKQPKKVSVKETKALQAISKAQAKLDALTNKPAVEVVKPVKTAPAPPVVEDTGTVTDDVLSAMLGITV